MILNRITGYSALIFVFAIGTSHGQTLASYDIPVTSSGTVAQATVLPSSGPAGVIASVISTGAGLSGDKISTGWGSASWGYSGSTSQSISTFSAALANGDYFEWSLTASPGYELSITGFGTLDIYRSSAGPTNVGLYYSLDNFATAPIALGTISSISTAAATPTPGTGLFNASPIAVRSGQTITFRLAGYGATAFGGTGRIKGNAGTSDFTILGTTTVLATPPKSVLWNGLPGATWSTNSADLFWLDDLNQAVCFNDGDTPSFNADASVLVAPAGVIVPSMTNNPSAGQNQTFSGGVIKCLSSLTKNGDGALNISNIFTNLVDVQLNGGKLALWGGGTNNLGGGSSITGMPNLTMAAGTTFDLGDTDQNVANFNGAGTVVMTNINSSGIPSNDFKVTCTIPSSFSGSITGVGTFRLSGGVFTNLGNNTYTGGTWISNGATMYIDNESALPRQTKDDPLTTTSGPGTAVDLRISSGGGTLGALSSVPLTLNRSIGNTSADGQIRIQAAPYSYAYLELAGPIYTERSIYITNPSSSAGAVILSGSNTFQTTTSTNATSGIITTNIPELRIAVNGKLLLKSQGNISGATLKVTDPSSSLGLAADVINEVVLTNSLAISNSADIANFNVGLGASQALRWNGPINGPGSLYLTNKGTLIFGVTNSYQGGTLLMNGGTLLVSAQSQLPATTNQLGRGGDVRFSTNNGSFGLDDSVGPINLNLTNSFYFERTGGFMAGTNTNVSTLTLAGSFYGTNAAYGAEVTNSFANVGKLILTGMNTNFVGSLRVGARGRVYVLSQTNLPAQLSFSDTSGSARFGLAEASLDDVTITNAISTGVNNTSIIATFTPGTNLTTAANKRLHLGGVISGPGRVRVAEGGDLCLDNSANTYTNLTRIGTGRILFGSDGALGGPSTNGSYGGIRFETISNSYLVPTNDVTLNPGRALLIENNDTANLDSQGYTLTVAGSVQDEVAGQLGSVNKLGSGEVVLSGTLTYSGNTTVSAGKLTLKQINSNNESSTVSIVAGANLNLDFVGSDTVDKLYLNGVQSAKGTYDSSNSGGAITGTGSLVVTSSPVIANTAPVVTAAQGFSVAENASLGAVVGTVAVTDADANSSLSAWTIVSGNTGSAFAINPATGQITLAGALNYEVTSSYSLGVTVSDGTATSAVGTVVITVTNIAEYSDPDLFGNASPTADDNGDGISNLMAYALGAASPGSLVVPPTLNTSDSTKLTITALIRINDPSLSVEGEYGLTPGTWVTGSPIPGVESSSQAGAVAGVTQRQDFSVPRETDPKKFLHLKATLQP